MTRTRIIAVLLSTVLLFSTAACSLVGDDDNNDPNAIVEAAKTLATATAEAEKSPDIAATATAQARENEQLKQALANANATATAAASKPATATPTATQPAPTRTPAPTQTPTQVSKAEPTATPTQSSSSKGGDKDLWDKVLAILDSIVDRVEALENKVIGGSNNSSKAQPPTTPTNSKSSNPTTVQSPFMTQSGGSTGTCMLDKIGTWSEIYLNGVYQGAQRIEIGGGGVEHFDFYPAPGVKAVSYLVPIGEPVIGLGHGSAWEAPNNDACKTFDWAKDLARYACDRSCVDPNSPNPVQRQENGHSGLVIDLRTSTPTVLVNLWNMSPEAINALLDQHRTGDRLLVNGQQPKLPNLSSQQLPPMSANPAAPQSTQQVAPPPPAPPAPPANRLDCGVIRANPDYLSSEERAWFLNNCVRYTPPAAQNPAPPAQSQAAPPANNSAPAAPAAPAGPACNATQESLSMGNHTIQGPAIVTLWTNRGPDRNPQNLKLPSWGQAEVKALIGQGETWTILDSGGTVFRYPAGCDPKVDFDANRLPAKSWDELHAADMVG